MMPFPDRRLLVCPVNPTLTTCWGDFIRVYDLCSWLLLPSGNVLGVMTDGVPFYWILDLGC
jgi:hypothetical protein